MQSTKPRVLALDGMRGVAILMVVWWHYFNSQLMGQGPISSSLKLAWKATSVCWSGVDLFFVLSGFLITGILLDESKARNVISIFYLRRAVRILPLYFLVLACAGIAFVWFGHLPAFGWLLDELPPVS